MYQSLLRQQLELLKSSNQYRTFTTLSRICGQYPFAKLNGEQPDPVVVWCSNDYLGMSQHPTVREQMHLALETYGAGSGGSRNIGGSYELYERLEASLADWHDKEAALVFPTGFGSNDATLQCLLRQIPDCVVISDALNHASIVNGIRATPNERQVFRHNDVEHLAQILSRYPIGQPKHVLADVKVASQVLDQRRGPIGQQSAGNCQFIVKANLHAQGVLPFPAAGGDYPSAGECGALN